MTVTEKNGLHMRDSASSASPPLPCSLWNLPPMPGCCYLLPHCLDICSLAFIHVGGVAEHDLLFLIPQQLPLFEVLLSFPSFFAFLIFFWLHLYKGCKLHVIFIFSIVPLLFLFWLFTTWRSLGRFTVIFLCFLRWGRGLALPLSLGLFHCFIYWLKLLGMADLHPAVKVRKTFGLIIGFLR